MAWFDEAVFYHIYPLGMLGAPKINSYDTPQHKLPLLIPYLTYIKEAGFNALYIGPLFESVGHGYETTDYKKLDSRLGTNDDLKLFVEECHKIGLKVIFDGVFNHTGRDFFAFRDIQKNRENSPYKNWYSIDFYGNNEYNDGFSYKNWGGYNLLVKLNQQNNEVVDYICDVIRFWVNEFDIDGIRLDAADVLDFNFMQRLRQTANEVKTDFWLMGEVIHGDYNRWANENTLHSVTNYHLHKALYSGHNDRNYFEIAHTVKRLWDMSHNLRLYNFVDNHDVERIYTKLSNKNHFIPVHILLYTLPGIPSVYYGSEFAIEGKKEKHSDDSLRPEIGFEAYKKQHEEVPFIRLIAALGKIRQANKALAYGDYKELYLTNRQYAFSRNYENTSVIVTVNCDDSEAQFSVPCREASYKGVLFGGNAQIKNGMLYATIRESSGEIWISDIEDNNISVHEIENLTAPEPSNKSEAVAENTQTEEKTESPAEKIPEAEKTDETDFTRISVPDIPYEEMSVAQLQAAVLAKLAKNGPVTEQMLKDVRENVYHNSLINWVKSFR